MNKKSSGILLNGLIGVLFFLLTSFSYGASLTKEEGKGLLSFTYYFYKATVYCDDRGHEKEITPFYKRELNIYGEYGVRNDLTLVFQTAFDSMSQGENSSSGLNDLEFGAVKRFYYDGKKVFSVKGIGIFPGGYSKSEKPVLGMKRYGFEGSVLGGYYSKYFYVDGQLGIRTYEGNISFARNVLMFGLKLKKWIEYVTIADGWYGLGGVPENRVTVSPKQRFLQLYNFLRFKKGSLSFITGFSVTPYARNTGKGKSVFIGVWREF
jgi:hypothetical protein